MLKKILTSLRFYTALFVFLLVGVVIFIIADQIIIPNYTNYNEGITLPDVSKHSLEEGAQMLEALGLRYEVAERRSNEAYPVNYIIDQTPAAGQIVKPNRKVYLKVNRESKPKVNVPNVEGLSLRNARIQLQNWGLQIGTLSYRSSPYKNTVLKQSIPKDTEVDKGSTVNLIISDGLGVKMIQIPELIGKSLSEAQRLIITSGLRIGRYTYQQRTDVEPNLIVGYQPNDQKELLEGTTIDLIISEEGKLPEINEGFILNDTTGRSDIRPDSLDQN